MTRLAGLLIPVGNPRVNIIYGPGVTDVYLDHHGLEYNFLSALTRDLQIKGLLRILHVSPTKPVYALDDQSRELAKDHLWPQREEVLQTGIINGIDQGPLGGIKQYRTSPDHNEAFQGMSDMHGLRLIDFMLKEEKEYPTGLIIFNAEVYLETFESTRLLNGYISEWLTMPSSNKNLIFFIFTRQESSALKESLAKFNLPDVDISNQDARQNVVRVYKVTTPQIDELERLINQVEKRNRLKVDANERTRILRWMFSENILLRSWMNRMQEVEILNLQAMKDKGWIRAGSDDLRSFDEKLGSLAGLQTIKNRMIEIRDWMRFQNYSKDTSIKPNLHMVFTGNPGTGKTTFARLMGDMFHEFGVLDSGHVVEVKGSDLISEYVGGTAIKTNAVIEKALDGVLFIDEAYSLTEDGRGGFGQEAVENILIRMENDRDRLVVILAGYPDKMDNFLDSNPGLNRRFPKDNRFLFEDFSPNELMQILEDNLTKRNLIWDQNIENILTTVIEGVVKTRRQGFGNAGDMLTMADSIERKCKSRALNLGLTDPVILIADIPEQYKFYLPSSSIDLDIIFQQFDRLVGLEPLRSYLYSMVRLIQFDRLKSMKIGLPKQETQVENFIFVGNPGTGKTTVARLIGKIYQNLGLLHKGHTVEVNASDLIAGFVGQTPGKTAKKIEEALDGVLFIDEAYALARNRGIHGSDFGLEAVDTLVKMIEDHKEHLVVILAGYPDEMKEFLASNPGLKSRFGALLSFPDLTTENLSQIFLQKIKEEYLLMDEKLVEPIGEILESIRQENPKSFGNAREVQRLFLYMKRKLAERIMMDLPINTNENVLPVNWNLLLRSDLAGYHARM